MTRLIDADKLPVRSIDETDLPKDKGLLVVLKEDIDNSLTVKFSLMPADETKEDAYKRGYEKGKIAGILMTKTRPQEVNCVLTMFGKCSYNETGCSDCEIKDKIRKALEERPQGGWIPVSERLPQDRDWYLGVFRESDTGFIGLPYICDYVGEVTKGTTNEGWILRHCTDVDNPSDYFRNLICVAWKPLPELYKEEGAV